MKMYVRESCDMGYYCSDPETVLQEFKDLAKTDQESFWILGLNNRNKVMCKDMIALGGVASCTISIRVIMKRLIVNDCTGLITVHNHPSGAVDPSEDDIRLASLIQDACSVMEVRYLDNIIVGNGYFSFREKAIMPVVKQ